MTISQFLASAPYTITDTEIITEGDTTTTTVKMTEGERVWLVRHIAQLGRLKGISARCVNRHELPRFTTSKDHEWAENYVAWKLAAES